MEHIVFFSWQADTPTRIGRNFLRDVLDEVCKNLQRDTDVSDAPRNSSIEVDSDTQNVAGQPPIALTIFNKIDKSSVFVADMTFVGTRLDERPTPNPNVLIEYGWALKSLSHSRVISLMNTAYGEPSRDNLPFDLSHLRWPIGYNLSSDASPETKAAEKKKLVAILTKAISASLNTLPTPETELPAAFPQAQSLGDPGRFRNIGEEIGIDDNFSFSQSRIFLSKGPAMWLRVMPTLKQEKHWPPYELKEKISNNTNLSPILIGNGFSFLRGADGYGTYRGGSLSRESTSFETDSIAFAFESGEVWAIETAWLAYSKEGFPFLEQEYRDALSRYGQFLETLGIQVPYKWIAGVTGVKDRIFSYPVRGGHNSKICLVDTIEEEGIYNGDGDTKAALLPFFKKIFEKCGVSRPEYL